MFTHTTVMLVCEEQQLHGKEQQLNSLSGISWLQVQYSLLYRRPETNGVFEACKENNVTLVAYSPMCQGLLTGNISITPHTCYLCQADVDNLLTFVQPLVISPYASCREVVALVCSYYWSLAWLKQCVYTCVGPTCVPLPRVSCIRAVQVVTHLVSVLT